MIYIHLIYGPKTSLHQANKHAQHKTSGTVFYHTASVVFIIVLC